MSIQTNTSNKSTTLTAGSHFEFRNNSLLMPCWSLFIKHERFFFGSQCLLSNSSLCSQHLVAFTWRHRAIFFSVQSLELCDLSDYRCGRWFCCLGWCTDNNGPRGTGQHQCRPAGCKSGLSHSRDLQATKRVLCHSYLLQTPSKKPL